ncbi:hypothetical protein JTB14_007680 [Gonioctena quinquepunctata]|nr:hypothetical protein JTB14_007680 [Gonioctena quinquepunctata]
MDDGDISFLIFSVGEKAAATYTHTLTPPEQTCRACYDDDAAAGAGRPRLRLRLRIEQALEDISRGACSGALTNAGNAGNASTAIVLNNIRGTVNSC